MKILLYTNSFYPDSIGIAYYNTELVEHLLKLGHTVQVLTALPYYPQWRIREGYRGRWQVHEKVGAADVWRRWLYVPSRQTALGRFFCELSFMLTSLPALFRCRADVVLAVSPPFGVGLAAAIHRQFNKSRLWLHLQDLQVDAGQAVGFLRGRGLVAVLTTIERWILRRADLISTISVPMRDRVQTKEISATSLALLPNWVDTHTMRPMPRETAFRREHKLEGKFVVLYAGSLGIHQGLDELIDVAAGLRDRPSIAFVIIGDGNYRAALEKRLSEHPLPNVTLLPLQPKERLAEVLSSADVGIVMELRRMADLSLSSKILNQMACGRPLIAVSSPETALSRLVKETEAGVVVSPGNAQLLEMAILELASAPERVAAMGKAARTHIEKEASRDRLLATVPGLLEQTLRSDAELFREYPLKRCLDIVLAMAGFVVSLPFWLVIPLAIVLEDRGPVFYRQERVGRFGIPFLALKFRSMVRMELPEYDRRQAHRGDPRITRVGQWCRRTAMDEIPQLWNILKGDMSFVGPRALMPSEIEARGWIKDEISLEKIPGYQKRVRLRPGLTGVAQVFAARDVKRRNKFRYDLLYVKRQSLWLDIALILRSGWNSLFARWENVGVAR
ncbi:MAG: WcaI family glycosyltransferase [Elusimicrobiota bacterium]|jgi:colanic acid biosynthesis glycosyl transferase WcaI